MKETKRREFFKTVGVAAFGGYLIEGMGRLHAEEELDMGDKSKEFAAGEKALDLSPFLTQPVKTQNPFKGELSHGVVEKSVHQGVQAGRGAAAGARSIHRRGGAGVGSERERAAPLAA
jgi:hypothetical protein